jgi:16S rRNA C1402 (ribose-2'-O) methylase RsmI
MIDETENSNITERVRETSRKIEMVFLETMRETSHLLTEEELQSPRFRELLRVFFQKGVLAGVGAL